MLNNITQILTSPLDAIAGSIKSYFQSRNRIKEAEVKARLDILSAKTKATVDLLKQGVAQDIAWQNLSGADPGWKDEFWTLLISAPLIAIWFPGGPELVQYMFTVISGFPEWYQIVLGGAAGTALGFRKFADVMALKNGVDLSKIGDIKKVTDLLNTNNK